MSLRQTCSQRVTGRRLRYRRALQIVQDEEYLSAVDLDDIRRYENLYGYSKHLSRDKRQSYYYTTTTATTTTTTTTTTIISKLVIADLIHIHKIIKKYCKGDEIMLFKVIMVKFVPIY